MFLIRIIVIALIIWLLYRLIYGLINKQKPSEKPHSKHSAQDMVKCAHCGIHIPRSEALEKDGHSYCSPEHRDAGPT